MLFQDKWRPQQFYGCESYPARSSNNLPCWDRPLQGQSDALAVLNTSLLWPYRKWLSDQLFSLTIWHTTPKSFFEVVARWHWYEYITYTNEANFSSLSNHLTENGCYHKTRKLHLVFIDGNVFKFLDHVVCEVSLPHSARLSFTGWHI